MTRHLRTLTPVVAFAAAVAAGLATISGGGDATSHASARAPAAPVATTSEPLFMSEGFAQQKRNAAAEELPAQF